MFYLLPTVLWYKHKDALCLLRPHFWVPIVHTHTYKTNSSFPYNTGMVFSTSISSLKTTTTEVKNMCNWFGFFSKTCFSSSHIFDLIFVFYALSYIVWCFSMQILNIQVKRFNFLFQSYCNPSSHAEIEHLGFFLKSNFIYLGLKHHIIIKYISSQLSMKSAISIFKVSATPHIDFSNQRQKTHKESTQNPMTFL